MDSFFLLIPGSKRLRALLLSCFFISATWAQVDVVYNDLVWSDEFDSPGAINSTKWHHQTQIPAGGSWYNNEVQHYTNRLANSSVSGGNLNITALKESFTDQGVTKQYTSARLNSKYAFRYGRVDIRAKAPNGPGTWPALWLLGKNINEPGAFFSSQFGTTSWPACGELDIMEHGIFPNQPINYIGSAIHTPSSFGNTVNKGGIQANDISQNYHVYSMNWSPFQITFLLDGVAFYTYNPAIKDANTWPFDKEQYLIFNIAMGGFAGNIPPNFTQANMIIDYVRVYQNITPDTQIPTNFTASLGTITGSTVELKLNGLDNSGILKYIVSYNGQSDTVFGNSGVEKSAIISGLSPSTNYSISIIAKDLSGNAAANNPIVLNATTLLTLECEGTDNQATQGSFTDGYRYKFETFGTSVKITFELLDNKPDLIAYLWRQSPFSEVQMTNVGGRTFAHTITGQTIGATINYACKFAFAGGLAVTRYVPYVVGSNCVTGVADQEMVNFTCFPVPSEGKVYFSGLDNGKYAYALKDLTGKTVQSGQAFLATEALNFSDLKNGIYFLGIRKGGKSSFRKIVVQR
jgi:beta-glucanase (GH16 family)